MTMINKIFTSLLLKKSFFTFKIFLAPLTHPVLILIHCYLEKYDLIDQLKPQLRNKLKDIILSDRKRSPEFQVLPQHALKVNLRHSSFPLFEYFDVI